MKLATAAACSLAVAEVGVLFEALHAEKSVVAWEGAAAHEEGVVMGETIHRELTFKNGFFGALSDVFIRHDDDTRWALHNLGTEKKGALSNKQT